MPTDRMAAMKELKGKKKKGDVRHPRRRGRPTLGCKRFLNSLVV